MPAQMIPTEICILLLIQNILHPVLKIMNAFGGYRLQTTLDRAAIHISLSIREFPPIYLGYFSFNHLPTIQSLHVYAFFEFTLTFSFALTSFFATFTNESPSSSFSFSTDKNHLQIKTCY